MVDVNRGRYGSTPRNVVRVLILIFLSTIYNGILHGTVGEVERLGAFAVAVVIGAMMQHWWME